MQNKVPAKQLFRKGEIYILISNGPGNRLEKDYDKLFIITDMEDLQFMVKTELAKVGYTPTNVDWVGLIDKWDSRYQIEVECKDVKDETEIATTTFMLLHVRRAKELAKEPMP